MTEKTELLKRWALTTAETYPELWSEDDEKLFQSILTDHQPSFAVGEYYSDGRLVYKMLAIGDESNQYLALTLDLKEQNSRLVKCFWHEYEIKKDKPATAEQIATFKRAEHFASKGRKLDEFRMGDRVNCSELPFDNGYYTGDVVINGLGKKTFVAQLENGLHLYNSDDLNKVNLIQTVEELQEVGEDMV